MWLVENGAILTKDNMIKINWSGSPSYFFCSADENIEHLFFTCPIAKVIWGMVGTSIGANNIPSTLIQYKKWIRRWLPDGSSIYTFELSAICWAIWKRRNEACFDNKLLRSPTEIITYACALMSYWSGLYGPEMQGKILEGVKTLLSCVHWASAQPRRPPPLLLLNSTPSQASQEETSEDEE